MLSKGCYESPEIQEKRAGRVSFCTGANVTEKLSAGKGWWASGQSLGVMVALVGAAGPELRLPAANLQVGSLELPGCRAAGARLRCRKRGARSTRLCPSTEVRADTWDPPAFPTDVAGGAAPC